MLTYTIDADAKLLSKQKSYLKNAMKDAFGYKWDVTPVGSSDFHMEIKSLPFGQMSLSHASLSQAEITNIDRPSYNTPEHTYNIYISNRRHKVVTSDKTIILEPGDVTVTDSAMEVTMTTQEPYTTIGLTVPASLLHTHISTPDKVVGTRFSGKTGFSKIVSCMLFTMWEYAQSENFGIIGNDAANNLLATLSICCNANSNHPEEWNSNIIAKRENIKQMINKNLQDPDLCVSELAKQFGISTRYIQRLFSEDDYTISRYIRHQRLEACKRQLVDPAWLNHSITDIAFNWGFNSSAHFARVFKEEYGMNAREYRKQSVM